MDRRVYAAFGLLIGSFVTIVWYIIPQPPDVALVGVRYRSAWYIDSYSFEPGPGVPADAALNVFEATLHDGTQQQRAYVTFKDRPPQYLGPLTRQLGDAPLQTIFVRAGNDRVIMGWIDKSVSGHYDPNISFVASKINPRSNRLDRLPGQGLKQSFRVAIHEDEAERWRTLTKIYIWSEASIERSTPQERPNSNSYRSFDEDVDSDWVRHYNPPFDIEHLYIRVGDEYASSPPTNQ